MTTKVFKFGSRGLLEGWADVLWQLRLAHRYRNRLVEVELARRAALKQIEAEWKEKDKVRFKQEREAMHDRVLAYKRALRAECGLYWGTYLLVEQAAGAAAKGKEDPNFKAWRGEGRVGVQISSNAPLSVSGALACRDLRLRIERLPDEGRIQAGSRRSGRNAVVWIRVGSNPDHSPVWAKWSVILHRLPPLDARISWAWMQRVKIGPDYRWFLCLTVDGDYARDELTDPDRTGTVAVDLGWRVRRDGVRVGYWLDDQGNGGEYLLPDGLRDKMDHARSIKSIRDRNFNAFRDRLADLLAGGKAGQLPEWLAKATRTLRQWRSADRLFELAWRWRRNRFAGDDAVFTEVEAWWRQDRHLHQWYANEEKKVIARRDEMYREIAVALARKYRRVIIEDFDLREVAGRRKLTKGATDAEKKQADAASSVRHVIAPGTFRLKLMESCSARGTEVVKVNPAYTTIDCCKCGVRIPWDPRPNVEHRCEACGTLVDQDYQACVNLHKRAAEASGQVDTEKPEALVPKKPSRMERMRAGKARWLQKRREAAANLSQNDV